MRDSNVCFLILGRNGGMCANLEFVDILWICNLFQPDLLWDSGLKGGVHMEQKSEEYTIEWSKEQIKNMVDRMNGNCEIIGMIYGFVRKCFEISGEREKEKL